MAVLYLFDIDGTLVDMTPTHVKAYKLAYKKVLGIDVAEKVLAKQFGNVERKIQEAIFRYYNMADRGRINKVTNLYISSLAKSVKKARIRVLPHVITVLKQLKKGKQPLGIVTGNSKKIGEAILKKTKLYRHFSIYSYGNVNRRAHIVRKAVKMAKRKKIRFGKVVVIGDAPFDVRAGKENNAFTVAVATGRYTLGELKKETPDLALKSLKDYRKLLKQTGL